MNVLDFDIERGIFHFQVDDLNAEKHSHPVVELIYATSGRFSLETDLDKFQDLTFAVIDSNVSHIVTAGKCQIELLMMESNNAQLTNFLAAQGIPFSNGVFTNDKARPKEALLNRLKAFSKDNNLKLTDDQRVRSSLEIIETQGLEYHELIAHLSSKVFLSESRLSHLFKENIGVSLKKYLVWNRLKNAIHFLLNENSNFATASLQSGFYDQAHLSNAFKRFLGVNPSQAYNSRTLQIK